MTTPTKKWVELLRAKDLRALSRLISMAENRDAAVLEVLKELYQDADRAKVIGITGPPGAGKSSLTANFIRLIRAQNKTVAVVAVDPVSPFTGGALLGDRIRLTEHFNDPGVYIRSLSTRGKLGGLSLSTRQVVELLGVFGFDFVLVETVGVGQSEIDIRKIADLTLLTLVPESGDSIQALKAGILEVADIFVVNKADRGGGEQLVQELKNVLHMAGRDESKVYLTSQLKKDTVEVLYGAVIEYFDKGSKVIQERRMQRKADAVFELVLGQVLREVDLWMESQKFSATNPYEFVMQFLRNHPPGSLFKNSNGK